MLDNFDLKGGYSHDDGYSSKFPFNQTTVLLYLHNASLHPTLPTYPTNISKGGAGTGAIQEGGEEEGLPGYKRWGVLGLLVVIVCSVVGNLLVCLAVCWERRLQNMTNYFLMSLAIADLLVSIVVMPLGMIVELFGYFPLEAEVCVVWVSSDVLMCTASIWHMCTMSMDRYFTLKYPMRYGRNKTKTMVMVKIFFVWVVSMAISSPICIHGFVDPSIVFNEGICMPVLKDFVIYGSVFAFYIPLFIMIVTYVLTLRILWKNQRLMQRINQTDLKPKLAQLTGQVTGFALPQMPRLMTPVVTDEVSEDTMTVSQTQTSNGGAGSHIGLAAHNTYLSPRARTPQSSPHASYLPRSATAGGGGLREITYMPSPLASPSCPHFQQPSSLISPACPHHPRSAPLISTSCQEQTQSSSLVCPSCPHHSQSSPLISPVSTLASPVCQQSSSLTSPVCPKSPLLSPVCPKSPVISSVCPNSPVISPVCPLPSPQCSPSCSHHALMNNTHHDTELVNSIHPETHLVNNTHQKAQLVNSFHHHQAVDDTDSEDDADLPSTRLLQEKSMSYKSLCSRSATGAGSSEDFFGRVPSPNLFFRGPPEKSSSFRQHRERRKPMHLNVPSQVFYRRGRIGPALYSTVSDTQLPSSSCCASPDHARSFHQSLGGLESDWKSAEWDRRFFQIQQEMDACLRDNAESETTTTTSSSGVTRSRYTPAMSTTSLIQRPRPQHFTTAARSPSRSAPNTPGRLHSNTDSENDADSSGSSNSNCDVITIRLHPPPSPGKTPSAESGSEDVQEASGGLPSLVVSSEADNTHDDSDVFNTNDDSPANGSRERVLRGGKQKRLLKARFRNTLRASSRPMLKHLMSSKTASNERKASKVLGIIFVVFVILWTPFFIANILSVTCETCMQGLTAEMMSVFVWMGYVASLANPIIYTMFNTAFRRTFIKILTCKMRWAHNRMKFAGDHPTAPPSMTTTANPSDRRNTMTVVLDSRA